jgi:hypothetical protein
MAMSKAQRTYPTRPPWGAQGQKARKEQKRDIRTRPCPIVFFLIYVIVGGIVGIAINDRFYAIERGEMNPPQGE